MFSRLQRVLFIKEKYYKNNTFFSPTSMIILSFNSAARPYARNASTHGWSPSYRLTFLPRIWWYGHFNANLHSWHHRFLPLYNDEGLNQNLKNQTKGHNVYFFPSRTTIDYVQEASDRG